MATEVDDLAEVVWNYHVLKQQLVKADALWVLCSNVVIVADYAAKLFKEGWAPKIIYSGGMAHQSDLLNTGWNKPEAEIFADVGRKMGIADAAMIIENKSTNTGENIRFTYELIKEKGLSFKSFILVQKPFMERRTYATFVKQWPGEQVEFRVTSPPISYAEYLASGGKRDDLINVMVGDLQRIKIYPDKGYQIDQEIPDEVWQAWERLVELGYSKHLLKG